METTLTGNINVAESCIYAPSFQQDELLQVSDV